MIEDRKQLEYTIKSVAKMYDLRDRDAAETLYHPSTRDAVVESTNSMIRKLEREIAAYLATHSDEQEAACESPSSASIEEVAVAEPVAA